MINTLSNFCDFQHTFPRTLEALVLNMLEPVGAEILTRKFDMMDQQTTSEEQLVLLFLLSIANHGDISKLLNGTVQG